MRRSVGALIPGVRPTSPLDRRRLQPLPAGPSVPRRGSARRRAEPRKHAAATRRRRARRSSPVVMELGEVRGEGRVLEQPAVEPGVEATERPGVGPAAGRADGARRRAVRRRVQLGRGGAERGEGVRRDPDDEVRRPGAGRGQRASPTASGRRHPRRSGTRPDRRPRRARPRIRGSRSVLGWARAEPGFSGRRASPRAVPRWRSPDRRRSRPSIVRLWPIPAASGGTPSAPEARLDTGCRCPNLDGVCRSGPQASSSSTEAGRGRHPLGSPRHTRRPRRGLQALWSELHIRGPQPAGVQHGRPPAAYRGGRAVCPRPSANRPSDPVWWTHGPPPRSGAVTADVALAIGGTRGCPRPASRGGPPISRRGPRGAVPAGLPRRRGRPGSTPGPPPSTWLAGARPWSWSSARYAPTGRVLASGWPSSQAARRRSAPEYARRGVGLGDG